MYEIRYICSDADGTLNDLESFQHWMVADYYTKLGKPIPEIKEPTAYDIVDIYEISKIQRQIIWLQYYKLYNVKYGPRSHAFEVLRNFQEMGKIIDIATAKAFVANFFVGGTVQGWFEKWLDDGGLKPRNIAYCSEKRAAEEKVEAIQSFKSQLMLEDRPFVFDKTLEVCDTVGMKQIWNEFYIPKNKPFQYYKANDFDDLPRIIDTIEKSKSRSY